MISDLESENREIKFVSTHCLSFMYSRIMLVDALKYWVNKFMQLCFIAPSNKYYQAWANQSFVNAGAEII